MNKKHRPGEARHTPTIVGEVPPITPEILKRLHFNPSEGLIWLEDSRMVLMRVEAMGALRQELIESLGKDAARGLLTRFGYAAGCRDAELALKMRSGTESMEEVFWSGAQLHALQGIVIAEKLHFEIDVERGVCNLEFIWKNCFEDQVHIEAYGIGGEPVCWVEVGHASGYLSTCMGKRILVREVACRSMGDEVCRCIAKPVEEWQDAGDDLRYFEPGQVRLKSRNEGDTDRSCPTADVPGACLPEPPEAAGQQEVIGASVAFNVVMHKIRRVAPTNATVLLLGESGVGKTVFACEIRRQSRRATGPFLEVNCAAIPEQLMEAELFGVERGAYTGAGESRPGRFQLADGGTLFLDEIGTLSMTAQGKLLRVIQTGEFEPLGGATITRKVDVRLVAATNEDLRAAVREGRFREDLFYRLNVFPIVVPPLRERRDDIPLLLERLIRRYGAMHGRRVSGITAQALQLILNYRWPGNIRELENVIERGVILGQDDQPLGYSQLFTMDGEDRERGTMGLNELGLIAEQTIPTGTLSRPAGHANLEADALFAWAEGVVKLPTVTLTDVENSLVKAAFDAADGNLSKAAGMLGITRAQLAYRIKKMENPMG